MAVEIEVVCVVPDAPSESDYAFRVKVQRSMEFKHHMSMEIVATHVWETLVCPNISPRTKPSA